MGKPENIELLQALAVTAEVMGAEFSDGAAMAIASDLSQYPLPSVLLALRRVRLECKGRMSLADIISRIDDGRPGPDEAWAMIPVDERGSCVWTMEMAQAWGIAYPLIVDGDRIGARMAFRDAYTRIVAASRAHLRKVQWMPSLGRDHRGREAALAEAVEKGRLTHEHAQSLLPSNANNVLSLPAPDAVPMPDHVRQKLEDFRRRKVAL
jgi:hypothetical protein